MVKTLSGAMSTENEVLSKPVMFGKYCLLERISVGGMAEVFKAKQFGVEGFERLLAVKRILDTIAEDEVFIKMFIDEAKIAGQLNHPNIAQIFDLGQHDGSYFIALEYVSGKDLRTLWERMVDIGEGGDIFMSCHIIMKVCEALQYAHAKKDAAGNDLNIVHRDISPQNILISHEGDVKIIDFGIAKAQGKSSQTQVGILKGKFSYMSPEQVRGLHVDHRADIFSLGIVLYELLTARRLFLGDSDFDTLEKIRKVEMSPPTLYNPHIPRELEDIVLKSLAKNSEERYQSGSEFHDALERFMRNQSSYYGAKDLAQYMKAAFVADIELERKKLDYYRTINAETLGSAGAAAANASLTTSASHQPVMGSDPFAEDPETQIYGRGGPASLSSFAEINPASEFGAPSQEPASTGGQYAEGPLSFAGGPASIQPTSAAPSHDALFATAAASSSADVMGVDLNKPLDDEDDPTIEWDRIGLAGLSPPPSPTAPAPPPSPEPAIKPPEPAMVAPVRPAPAPAPLADEEPPSLMEARHSHRSSTGLIVALVALIMVMVIGGIAAVYFLPRLLEADKVQIRLKVADAERISVTIDGKVAYSGPNQREITVADLDPGERQITISADGYEPATDKLTLQPGGDYEIPIKLKASDAPADGAKLLVKVEPKDATITLDGKKLDGAPPLTAPVKAGKYILIFKKDGFLDEIRELTVADGATETVDVTMRPARVKLEVTSDPVGADVAVYEREADDERTRQLVKSGKTPLALPDLDARKVYDVEVYRDGFERWKQTFTPGVKASEAMASKLVEKDDKAEPVVAAKDDKPNDKNNPDKATAADRKRKDLERRRKAEEDRKRKERLLAEKNRNNGGNNGGGNNGGNKTVENKPPVDNSPGYVAIGAKPQARIILDGRDIGYTPKAKIPLPPGRHRAVLKMESIGVTKTYSFTIKPGATHMIQGRP